MAEEKVYEPTIIPDQPLPSDVGVASQAGGTQEKDVYTQGITPDKEIPKPTVARHLVSEAIDTLARRILGVFQFGKMGAIQIGKQEQGVSGEVKISPDGVVAKNQSGEQTFALDGQTGDAAFKGTVQAGSLISGELIVGGAGNAKGKVSVLDEADVEKVLINKDGIAVSSGKITLRDSGETTIIDATGLVSGANFASGNVVDTSARYTTSYTATDVANTSLSFTLPRSAKVLIMALSEAHFTNLEGDETMAGNVFMNIDGSDEDWPPSLVDMIMYTNQVWSTASRTIPLAYMKIKTLSAGSHTIKLRFNVSGGSGDDRFEILKTSVMYIVLGK